MDTEDRERIERKAKDMPWNTTMKALMTEAKRIENYETTRLSKAYKAPRAAFRGHVNDILKTEIMQRVSSRNRSQAITG